MKVRHERLFEKMRQNLLEARDFGGSICSNLLAYHLEQKEIDEFIREW
jgi:hypothetical protein